MIDHITLVVKDFIKSKAFFEKSLAPLGFKELMGAPGEFCGFGKDRPVFWLSASDIEHPVSGPTHIAFKGENKDEIVAFHTRALEAGGKDNGAPGYCEEYGPLYYAAFVIDLDGNNIEVVMRGK